MKRLSTSVLVSLAVLVTGCVAPSGGGGNGAPAAPETANGQVVGDAPKPSEPPIMDKEKALAAINEAIAATTLYCHRGKKFYPDATKGPGKVVQEHCDGIYTKGNGTIQTLADFVQTNTWNSIAINERVAAIESHVDDVKAQLTAGAQSSNDWSKVAPILVDTGFRIWDGWRNRKKEDRKEFADLMRAKKFPSYESLVVESDTTK